jgi:hypothetical protein
MKRKATGKDLTMDTLEGARRKGVTDRWTAGKDFF